MDLNSAQKATLTQWVSDGLSLNEIQNRLRTEFEIAMTYMEVRFLIDDLDLEFQKAKPIVGDAAAEEEAESSIVDNEPVVCGEVTLELDRINQPSMIVSGSVVFSDGIRGSWGIDQSGRPVLKVGKEGYQPNQEDLQVFQEKLVGLLQSQGFYS